MNKIIVLMIIVSLLIPLATKNINMFQYDQNKLLINDYATLGDSALFETVYENVFGIISNISDILTTIKDGFTNVIGNTISDVSTWLNDIKQMYQAEDFGEWKTRAGEFFVDFVEVLKFWN